jgi:type II secretory pathway pseudopilin PulG
MKLIKNTASGMSLVELSAVMVVMSVIGLGLVYASQAVLFHYHNDQVRQEVRNYGNIIITEIAEELNKSQKVSIDGLNGFSRLQIFDDYLEDVPSLSVTAHSTQGIRFNGQWPLNNNLVLPGDGYFFDNGRRQVRLIDFSVQQETGSSGGSPIFRQSLLHIELTLEIETDSYENDSEITEEHYFQRKVFLGNYYLNTSV